METALKQLREITNRLQDAEEMFLFAVKSAELGIWDWYVDSNRLVWDSQMLEIFGISEDDFTHNMEAFESLVHPNDIPVVKAKVKEALATGKFRCTYRVKRGTSYIFVAARGKVIYDPTGKPTRMLGVAWVELECPRYASCPIREELMKQVDVISKATPVDHYSSTVPSL